MLKRHKDSKNKKVSKIKKKYKKYKKNSRIQSKKIPNIKQITFIGKASTQKINNINPNLHLTPKDDIYLKIQKFLFNLKKF